MRVLNIISILILEGKQGELNAETMKESSVITSWTNVCLKVGVRWG